jgi:hypothetical protein
MAAEFDRIMKIVSHVQEVQRNCIILGERLSAKGEFKLARQLIANGFLHDNSKFFAVEFEGLEPSNPDQKELQLAIRQHNQSNMHHPEYWDGGIHGMPRVEIAEMVCDWKGRSSEQGTSLRDWIHNEAMKRYKFKSSDEVYKTIMEFVGMLCDPPFKKPEAT